jgi:hypothetical protein
LPASRGLIPEAVRIRPASSSESTTPAILPPAGVETSVAIDDREADEAVRAEGGAPLELDCGDPELLDRGEVERPAPGPLHHLARLGEADPVGRLGSLRHDLIQMTGDRVRERSLAHLVSLPPVGRG